MRLINKILNYFLGIHNETLNESPAPNDDPPDRLDTPEFLEFCKLCRKWFHSQIVFESHMIKKHPNYTSKDHTNLSKRTNNSKKGKEVDRVIEKSPLEVSTM